MRARRTRAEVARRRTLLAVALAVEKAELVGAAARRVCALGELVVETTDSEAHQEVAPADDTSEQVLKLVE